MRKSFHSEFRVSASYVSLGYQPPMCLWMRRDGQIWSREMKNMTTWPTQQRKVQLPHYRVHPPFCLTPVLPIDLQLILVLAQILPPITSNYNYNTSSQTHHLSHLSLNWVHVSHVIYLATFIMVFLIIRLNIIVIYHDQ